MPRKLTQQEFILKSKTMHGDKYDYSKVNYRNNRGKIELTCTQCGQAFSQAARGHLAGRGCRNCGSMYTTKEFVERAKKIHGNKFDYSRTIYVGSLKKLTIICQKCHSVFSQTADIHLKGNINCPSCRNKNQYLTTEEFVARAKTIHGTLYGYDTTKYKDFDSHVEIFCNKCKMFFSQVADYHLSGRGCPFCIMSRGEKKVENELNNNKIFFKRQFVFKKCRSKKDRPLRFDFYIPSKHTCIEFDGEQHSNKNSRFYTKQGEENDTIKNCFCKKNKINLVRISYKDYKEIKSIIKENLLSL